MKNKEELLKQARERFQESMDAEQTNRDKSIFDQKFENGEQWTEAELADRAGRPCFVINKVAGTIKQVSGEMRQNTPAIKVRAVDDRGDKAIADIFTGLIRDIENKSDARAVYDYGANCAVRGGYGYWRILTDYENECSFDQEIRIKRVVNPQSVYFDQSSVEPDYSDAEYAFISEMMKRDTFKKKYPKIDPASWEEGLGEERQEWATEDGIRIVEFFYKEDAERHIFELYDGKVIEVKNPKTNTQPMVLDDETGESKDVEYVIGDKMEEALPFKRTRRILGQKIMWTKLCGGGVLEGPQEWAGRYIPIIPCLGEEVWIEGERILRSAIYHSIDAQKLYNWARSNAVETLAMAPKQPFLVTPEEIEGHEAMWQSAHKSPRPYLLYNDTGRGTPQMSQPSMPNNAATKEAMHAADDIKATTGIFDASLGAKSNETSGKAIAERRAQGNISTYTYTDNQMRAIKYTGKILVDLIPKIYDTERVVRLLNEDGSEAWAKINVTDQMTGKVITNDISVGRFDVVVDTGPAYMSRRMEAADGLMMLAQTAPQYAPVLIPRIAKSLDWPDSDEVGEELRALNQPQEPSPEDQMKVEKGKMDIESKKMDIASKQADIDKKKQEMAQSGQDQKKMIYEIATVAVIDALKQIGMIPEGPTK